MHDLATAPAALPAGPRRYRVEGIRPGQRFFIPDNQVAQTDAEGYATLNDAQRDYIANKLRFRVTLAPAVVQLEADTFPVRVSAAELAGLEDARRHVAESVVYHQRNAAAHLGLDIPGLAAEAAAETDRAAFARGAAATAQAPTSAGVQDGPPGSPAGDEAVAAQASNASSVIAQAAREAALQASGRLGQPDLPDQFA